MVGAAATRSVQGALALVVVAGLAALYAHSRNQALAGLWLLWMIAPLLRRIVDYSEGADAATVDVLSVAPFAATGIIGVLEFLTTPPSARARRIVALAAVGLAIGVPAGLSDPLPLTFATLAYGSALVAFFIGYAEVRRGGAASLHRALMVVVPLIALYGIYQWAFPLLPWDAQWVETSPLKSLGTKEEGDFRVFATLNAPGTLAFLLAVTVALTLAMRRLGARALITLGLALTCLGLTLMRAAWLGIAIAIITLLFASRGRLALRLGVIVVLTVATVVLLAGRSPAGDAIVERVDSLRDLSSDVSATERQTAVKTHLPTALRQPVGAGLGAVGEARRLSDTPEQPFPDNGWLATLYQVGPVGFLLIVAAIASAFMSGGPRRRSERWLLFLAPAVTLVALDLAADVLFGLAGAMLWYCLGALVADGEVRRAALTAARPPRAASATPGRAGPRPWSPAPPAPVRSART